MKAQIVKLKTRIKMQKTQIVGLEQKLKCVREEGLKALEKVEVDLTAAEAEIFYQKTRVAKRDKQIAALEEVIV